MFRKLKLWYMSRSEPYYPADNEVDLALLQEPSDWWNDALFDIRRFLELDGQGVR